MIRTRATQRAVKTQVCGVCGWREPNKAAMDEHINQHHGVNWPPAEMRRSRDQMEFRPHLMETPWGKVFKQWPRRPKR